MQSKKQYLTPITKKRNAFTCPQTSQEWRMTVQQFLLYDISLEAMVTINWLNFSSLIFLFLDYHKCRAQYRLDKTLNVHFF